MNCKRLNPFLFTITLVSLLGLLSGCGGSSSATWPTNPDQDWIKDVNGRGMANVWGVIFDVEKIEGSISINPSGDLGTSPEDTTASNDIFFGRTAFKLETTGKRSFKLSLNGKDYGRVRGGDRVHVDENQDLLVNDEFRDPS